LCKGHLLHRNVLRKRLLHTHPSEPGNSIFIPSVCSTTPTRLLIGPSEIENTSDVGRRSLCCYPGRHLSHSVESIKIPSHEDYQPHYGLHDERVPLLDRTPPISYPTLDNVLCLHGPPILPQTTPVTREIEHHPEHLLGVHQHHSMMRPLNPMSQDTGRTIPTAIKVVAVNLLENPQEGRRRL